MIKANKKICGSKRPLIGISESFTSLRFKIISLDDKDSTLEAERSENKFIVPSHILQSTHILLIIKYWHR